MTQDKRLIEHYIPIKAISAEASREKSIRHGHISTLHLWWARRPLVASRAAVFAALVSADAKPKLTVKDRPDQEPRSMTMTEFMIELCKWELRDEILEEARRLINEAYPDHPPKVLDMFAGGGAIPLEALRLGAEAYALDLNPVAHIIQLATLVYPQKYGKKLADDVQKWGDWVLERVREEVGDLYPLIPDPDYDPEKLADEKTNQMGLEDAEGGKDFERNELIQMTLDWQEGDEDIDWDEVPDASTADVPEGWLQPIAYLWTRVVTCPNPTCRASVPLVRQTWLRRTKGHYVALEMLPHQTENRMAFHVRHSYTNSTKAAIEDFGFDPSGYSQRGTTTCHMCGTTVTSDYAKQEGIAARIESQMMAVVCNKQNNRGKTYLSPDDLELPVVDAEDTDRRMEQLSIEYGLPPPTEAIGGSTQYAPTPVYGFTTFADLFTSRQCLTLLTYAKYVRQAADIIAENAQSKDYSSAVALYLAISLDKALTRNTTGAIWDLSSANGRLAHIFARQAIPMVWDFAEANPLGGASGDFALTIDGVIRVLNNLPNHNPATVYRGSATNSPFEDESIDTIITDPPYYDNVPYSDLADFFYVWLKRSIGNLFPEHFTSELTPKKKEAVSFAFRHEDNDKVARDFYENMMLQSFREANRILRRGGHLVTVYAHKTTAGWSTLVEAMRRAEFTITEA